MCSGQSPASEKPVGEVSTSSVFQFEASPNRNRDIEIYGTLPHRKKSRSAHGTPLKAGNNLPKPANTSLQDPARSSARRAEGFSRLLEFTRQQQEELETCQLSTFEVTQSLPVCPGRVLQDIEEDVPHGQMFSVEGEELCLLGSLAADTPAGTGDACEAIVESMDLKNTHKDSRGNFALIIIALFTL